MLKFLMKFNYSSASWARMLAVTDDRSSTVAALLEHLGGKLESMHWEVEDTAAYNDVGAADGGGCGFGQAEVAHLARLHELRRLPCRRLQSGCRPGPGPGREIDDIGGAAVVETSAGRRICSGLLSGPTGYLRYAIRNSRR
jgi:hypothetical protein